MTIVTAYDIGRLHREAVPAEQAPPLRSVHFHIAVYVVKMLRIGRVQQARFLERGMGHREGVIINFNLS